MTGEGPCLNPCPTTANGRRGAQAGPQPSCVPIGILSCKVVRVLQSRCSPGQFLVTVVIIKVVRASSLPFMHPGNQNCLLSTHSTQPTCHHPSSSVSYVAVARGWWTGQMVLRAFPLQQAEGWGRGSSGGGQLQGSCWF